MAPDVNALWKKSLFVFSVRPPFLDDYPPSLYGFRDDYRREPPRRRYHPLIDYPEERYRPEKIYIEYPRRRKPMLVVTGYTRDRDRAERYMNSAADYYYQREKPVYYTRERPRMQYWSNSLYPEKPRLRMMDYGPTMQRFGSDPGPSPFMYRYPRRPVLAFNNNYFRY